MMYSVFCEWDIGQEDQVFTTKEVANAWLLENSSLEECFEDGLTGQAGIDDLIDAGLLGFTGLTVHV